MRSPELGVPVERHSLHSSSVFNTIFVFRFRYYQCRNACSPKYITENVMKEVTFLIARGNRMLCRSAHGCSVRDRLRTVWGCLGHGLYSCAQVFICLFNKHARRDCAGEPALAPRLPWGTETRCRWGDGSTQITTQTHGELPRCHGPWGIGACFQESPCACGRPKRLSQGRCLHWALQGG